MTTINGKLIATDRQELDKAKQQIVILQQQQEQLQRSVTNLARDKDLLAKEINTCKQLKSNLSALDRQIKKMSIEIQTQQMYLISSILIVVFVFAGGLLWLANTSKAKPAELVDRHNHPLNLSSRK